MSEQNEWVNVEARPRDDGSQSYALGYSDGVASQQAEIEALGKLAAEQERDKEYNAELVAEKEAKIERLRKTLRQIASGNTGYNTPAAHALAALEGEK